MCTPISNKPWDFFSDFQPPATVQVQLASNLRKRKTLVLIWAIVSPPKTASSTGVPLLLIFVPPRRCARSGSNSAPPWFLSNLWFQQLAAGEEFLSPKRTKLPTFANCQARPIYPTFEWLKTKDTELCMHCTDNMKGFDALV